MAEPTVVGSTRVSLIPDTSSFGDRLRVELPSAVRQPAKLMRPGHAARRSSTGSSGSSPRPPRPCTSASTSRPCSPRRSSTN